MMVLNDDQIYYIAKAIAEEFYCQEDDVDEMNADGYKYAISGRYVHFIREEHKIKIETHYFNEFDEKCPKPQYSRISSFTDWGVYSYGDFAKVIGIYLTVFDEDYPCYFGTLSY